MTQSEIADICGVTQASVSKWLKSGRTAKEIIISCVSKQIRKEAADSGDLETEAEAARRDAVASADLKELRLKKERGELVPLAHAVLAGASMGQMTRQRLMPVGRLAGPRCRVAETDREAIDIITAEVITALQHLSNDFLSLEDLPGSVDGDPATSPADGDGVGGETPDR